MSGLNHLIGKKRQPEAARSKFFFDAARYPHDWHKEPDEELVARYQKTGNQLLICLLLQRHKAPIIGLSMRYLKDMDKVVDFCHRLYEKLVKKLKDKEADNFQAFLLTVVKNMHKDDWDKHKVRERYQKEHPPKEAHSEENRYHFGLDNPLSQEKLLELRQKNVLSAMEYACMKLYLQEMKSGEIARVIDPAELGIKADNDLTEEALYQLKKDKVYAAIERARRKLREHLGNDFGDYFKST
ncbi:MAG: sigma-70 family RNA polymerase sigma factor [Bacteroidetes bacterium]|nr:MAG: sigma-70 family RNA polymerase sigma factor [Bacteroidota bacterium]